MFKLLKKEVKTSEIINVNENCIDFIAWKLINYDRVEQILNEKAMRDKDLPFGKLLEFKNEAK